MIIGIHRIHLHKNDMDVPDGQLLLQRYLLVTRILKMLLLKTGDPKQRNRGSHAGAVVMTDGPILSPTLLLLFKTATALTAADIGHFNNTATTGQYKPLPSSYFPTTCEDSCANQLQP